MSEKPAIIIGGGTGFHNGRMTASRKRLIEGKAYQDVSTVMVIPTRGVIPARVVESWMNLMTPMNQKFVRMFVRGMEVADAYNTAVEFILGHPDLSKWKYMLTLEEDNMPPPDGLLRLIESIGDKAAVGGLYWTKGEGGQPMIYGDPKGILDFIPQVPKPNSVQECNGIGMGFTLFRLDVFRKLEKPWFKTVQEYSPEKGGALGTQDLYFFGNARRAGFTVASDNRVRVGHYEASTDMVW